MEYTTLPPFEDYFRSASESVQVNLKEDPSGIVSEISKVHTLYADHIFSGGGGVDQVSALLGIQAYYSLLAAANVGMSGHAAATYPLYRAALEAACYSFLTNHDPEMSHIWVKRHENDEARKLCRNKFTSAVRDAAKLVEMKDYISSGTETWVKESYDLAIDFGAHPNPKSIFHHVTIDEEYSPEEVAVSITALHAVDGRETVRSLLAFLEYALVIGVILTARSADAPTVTLQKLNELNADKKKLAKSFGIPQET